MESKRNRIELSKQWRLRLSLMAIALIGLSLTACGSFDYGESVNATEQATTLHEEISSELVEALVPILVEIDMGDGNYEGIQGSGVIVEERDVEVVGGDGEMRNMTLIGLITANHSFPEDRDLEDESVRVYINGEYARPIAGGVIDTNMSGESGVVVHTFLVEGDVDAWGGDIGTGDQCVTGNYETVGYPVDAGGSLWRETGYADSQDVRKIQGYEVCAMKGLTSEGHSGGPLVVGGDFVGIVIGGDAPGMSKPNIGSQTLGIAARIKAQEIMERSMEMVQE